MHVHHLCALRSQKRRLDLPGLVMSHHRFGNLGPLQGGKCSNYRATSLAPRAILFYMHIPSNCRWIKLSFCLSAPVSVLIIDVYVYIS